MKLLGDRMIECGQPVFSVNGFTEITTEQARKTFSLIRVECCNHEAGNCKMLMDDTDSRCKQLRIKAIICSWFREAVLPLNKELEAQIFKTEVKVKSSNHSHMKWCVTCGKRFKSITGRGKYCNRCAIKNQRKQQAEYNRKRRSKAKNSVVL